MGTLLHRRCGGDSQLFGISPLLQTSERSPMEKPDRRSLLPGVRDAGTPPAIVIDSRAVIVRARRRAAVRDVLDRTDSLAALLLLNAVMVAFVWLTRAFPRWRARRVAATLCAAERTRVRF